MQLYWTLTLTILVIILAIEAAIQFCPTAKDTDEVLRALLTLTTEVSGAADILGLFETCRRIDCEMYMNIYSHFQI